MFFSRPKKRPGFPDFLGIGAQKAGTSWLYYNLKLHKDLFLPEPKELHYFNSENPPEIEVYENYFLEGDGKVRGEITPAYSVLEPRIIKKISRYNPDLKILLILRDKIERSWSHALMDLVVSKNRDFKDVGEDEFFEHFKRVGSVKRNDYEQIIKNWQKFFPKEQILVLDFKDIKDSPVEFLNKVFVFLGVRELRQFKNFYIKQQINKGPEIEIPEKYRAFLAEMYGESAYQKLFK